MNSTIHLTKDKKINSGVTHHSENQNHGPCNSQLGVVLPPLASISKTVDRNRSASSSNHPPRTSTTMMLTSTTSYNSALKQRIQFLIKDVNYESMSDSDINNQYKKLRKILKQLNQELAKVLDRAQATTALRSPVKNVDVSQIAEVRDRELENGSKMLSFYKLEYMKLKRRQEEVGQGTRENVQMSIIDARAAIEKTRNKIRELKKANKQIGNSFELEENSLLKEIRRLQIQKTLTEGKRIKLLTQAKRVEGDIDNYKDKNNELFSQYLNAERVLKELEMKEQEYQGLKRNQITLLQKKSNLENIQKKVESTQSTSEQRYLNKLRQLQSAVSSIKKCTDKISQTDGQIMDAKRLIKQLEEKVRNREQSDKTNTEGSEEVFLTKPLDLTNYSPTPVSEVTQISLSKPKDTLSQIGATSKQKVKQKIVDKKEEQQDTKSQKVQIAKQSKAVHEIDIGTDDKYWDQDYYEEEIGEQNDKTEMNVKVDEKKKKEEKEKEDKKKLLDKWNELGMDDSGS